MTTNHLLNCIIYVLACIGLASVLGFIVVIFIAFTTPIEVEKDPEEPEYTDDEFKHVIF